MDSVPALASMDGTGKSGGVGARAGWRQPASDGSVVSPLPNRRKTGIMEAEGSGESAGGSSACSSTPAREVAPADRPVSAGLSQAGRFSKVEASPGWA